MLIIAGKIILTLWALFWFFVLGWAIKKEKDPEEWFTTFIGWVGIVLIVHVVLLIPFAVFSLIWF